MHYHPAIIANAVSYLQKFFDLPVSQACDKDTLLLHLTREIKILLRSDRNRLLHILTG